MKIVNGRSVLVCISLLAASFSFAASNPPEKSSPGAKAENLQQPKTLAELLILSAEQLDGVDVGLMNLLCAEGLPGAEHLDIQQCLESLDGWTERVRTETQRHSYRFAQHPELFCQSLSYFQMQMLADVLVNDLGIRYNPKRIEQSLKGLNTPEEEAAFFTDARAIFLFGLLAGDRYGTCASMPFLYLAIARRLGYPVNLAATQEHCYIRCEDVDGGHLNIEPTAVSRFKTPPDEAYRDMITAADKDAEISGGGLLRPLSNREILGHCLLSRLAALQSAGRRDEEIRTWNIVAKYLPDTSRWKESIKQRKRRAEEARLAALWQPIQKTQVPCGVEFVDLRKQRIDLRLLIASGADWDTVQKAAQEFNQKMQKYLHQLAEKDKPQTVDLPKTASRHHFRFNDVGKGIAVRDDMTPKWALGGIPSGLLSAIFEQGLESEDRILNFLWDRYEEAVIARYSSAAIGPLIESEIAPILIPRESVPEEYWKGLPEELDRQLAGETDPQQIVGIIRAHYYAREAERINKENSARQREASQSPLFSHAAPGAAKPPDARERQQLMQREIDAMNRKMSHAAVPLSQSRVRFVPGSSSPVQATTAGPILSNSPWADPGIVPLPSVTSEK